jgi:hypothetical protein
MDFKPDFQFAQPETSNANGISLIEILLLQFVASLGSLVALMGDSIPVERMRFNTPAARLRDS